jgi:crossover junction endodeoxyribonuclease RusA
VKQPLVKLSDYAKYGMAALLPSGKPAVRVTEDGLAANLRATEVPVTRVSGGAKAQTQPRGRTVRLPAPPSANRYWRNVKGRMVKSREGRAYCKMVAHTPWDDGDCPPMFGAMGVEVRWARRKRMGDLDNRLKVVLDSLRGIAWADDKQIVELHAYRSEGGDDTVTVTWWAA